MAPVIVAGLGVSGLGCALELAKCGVEFAAFEKELRPGGLARSEQSGEFHFDYGPHILLGDQRELLDLFRQLPDLDLVSCAGKSGVMLNGRAIPAPFQRHLNHLPAAHRIRLAASLVADRRRTASVPGNYADYARERCGRGVYDLFLRDYDGKRLRYPLEQIPPDWTSRVERTSLRSIVAPPAVSRWLGHSPAPESRFLYPRSGGIEEVPRAMARLLPPGSAAYGCELVGINPRSRVVRFADGRTAEFRHLVLSLPLPQTITLLEDPPGEIIRAAADLIYTSIYVVSLGLTGPVPDWSVLRMPSRHCGVYRLSFPSHYAPSSIPPGCSSVVGEISHHPDRHPMTRAEAREEVLRGIDSLGILGNGSGRARIASECIHDIRYGHVVYRHGTQPSLRMISEYLERHSIHLCGKYGLWKDMLIPEAIRSGQAVARAITGNAG